MLLIVPIYIISEKLTA